jgi:hypothetical protein
VGHLPRAVRALPLQGARALAVRGAALSFDTVIGCHCLGTHTAILLSLLSLAVKMTVSPWAIERGEAICKPPPPPPPPFVLHG